MRRVYGRRGSANDASAHDDPISAIERTSDSPRQSSHVDETDDVALVGATEKTEGLNFHPQNENTAGVVSRGSMPVQAPPPPQLALYEFPAFPVDPRKRLTWCISLASICHEHYNIRNIDEFRACLLYVHAEPLHAQINIRDFAQADGNELDETLRLFKMLHALGNSPVQDWRALELFFLFSGGFMGNSAHITFPVSFTTIQRIVGVHNAIGNTQIIPLEFLRLLQRSAVFGSDDTALCFAFCTIYHCRLNSRLGYYAQDNLYERFVQVLEDVYERLNDAADIVGCANWAALASPYLFFDVDNTIMTLYIDEHRARPQHRVSITGLPRKELQGYVNATLMDPARVDARFDLPPDRSRKCEAGVRKAVRLFGDLQLQFAANLAKVLSGIVPAPLILILEHLRATLLDTFPPPCFLHVITPPICRMCMTPIPLAISQFVAKKLAVHDDDVSDSPDSWSGTVRKRYLHGIPRDELISAEFERWHLNRILNPATGMVRVTTNRRLNRDDPVAIVYGFVTHESMKERPMLGDYHYGLPGASVSRLFNIRYGLSLDNPQAKQQLSLTDPGFSDMTGTRTCPSKTTIPSWYTLRIVPALHSAVMAMRRTDPHAAPNDVLYTSEAPTCYVKPLGPTFDTIKDLENELAFGVYALVDVSKHGECILDPKVRF